ncbi:MAG: IS630 family transposase [Methylobacter sp.]
MIEQTRTGKIELAYMDEAGFAPQQPNRSAWTTKGEVHAVTAQRAQRLNIIGALLSSGKRVTAKLWQAVNGLWMFGILMVLVKSVSKPLVVILDNASIHSYRQKAETVLGAFGGKRVAVLFLPPYSPELNRIEMLWRKMKHEWLPFRSFTPSELEGAIDEIGAGFGSKYQFTFC